MEVIRIGEFNTDALEQLVEIQPFDTALQVANNRRNNFACLKRLDYLLEFINTNHREILLKYVENLTNNFQDQIKENLLGDKKSILAKTSKETKLLNKYPRLLENTLNFSFQLLDLSNYINWMKDTVKVKQGNYIRSYLIPSYYYLQVLTETIGREEGINLFKRYISHFLKNQKTTPDLSFTTLKEQFERGKKAIRNPSDWVIIIGLLSEAKYVFRNDNCLWIDALEDLPDKELKYSICCYGDYQNASTYSNENTVLTMKHTIAQGDPYCSRVKHDIRYNWNLEHPDKEFFDSIWPVHDKQKKK
ncbi:MAG: L-2-amino-thiazoline-4-carboxylic acid hydrolase [Candidatus Heimdallarchaeota archaeon]|nr:L-2-amino-thiazoline-4-carboxylic acid hydrolase [Candidatus Heimdallarchaeota archaeon]